MLRPLTSLRFAAAIPVFLYHAPHDLGLRDVPLVREAYLGLTFFFVLSGFIIAYNYRTRFLEVSTRGLIRFYGARIARIWPVHLLALLATIPLVAPMIREAPALHMVAGVLNAFLLHTFVPVRDIAQSFNRPSWSLVDEAFFYALSPLVLWVLANLAVRRRVPAIWYVVAAGAVWAFAVALVLATRSQVADPIWTYYLNPVMRLPDFLVGMLVACWFLDRRRLDGVRSRVPAILQGRAAFTVLELGAIAALWALIEVSAGAPQELRFDTYYIPAMALLVLVFAVGRGWVSSLLSLSPLVYLGELSFSFYMFHQVVIFYWVGLSSDDGTMLVFVGTFLASLGVSALVYHTFEMPLRRHLRDYFNGVADRPVGVLARPGVAAATPIEPPPAPGTEPPALVAADPAVETGRAD